MSKIFTGIGSRETPNDILLIMEKLAEHMGNNGWILRSGGADGADLAFERGFDRSKSTKEIYIPWIGFNGSKSSYTEISRDAYKMVEAIHPRWSNLSIGARKLHARNCHQVLGYDLKTRSNLVICWTPEGDAVGGTRTAIKIAQHYGIPIINMFGMDEKTAFDKVNKHL